MVMETGVWVPAFAGMTGGAGVMVGAGLRMSVPRMGMTMGYFHGNCGLVGDGDGGLGPRFRGDDGWGGG